LSNNYILNGRKSASPKIDNTDKTFENAIYDEQTTKETLKWVMKVLIMYCQI